MMGDGRQDQKVRRWGGHRKKRIRTGSRSGLPRAVMTLRGKVGVVKRK